MADTAQPPAGPLAPAPAGRPPADAPDPGDRVRARYLGQVVPVARRVPEYDALGNPTGKSRDHAAGGERPLAVVPGVPPRDLTEAEWAALTPEQQAAAAESGLYALEGAR
jgi:hypothetical protein